jgi:hypothetical protein
MKSDLRTASYTTFLFQAKAWGLSAIQCMVLNEVRAGKKAPQSFGGLGLSQKLVLHHLEMLHDKELLDGSKNDLKISAKGEQLFRHEIILPWGDSDLFWGVWESWLEYRKQTHGSVYKPIGQSAALRTLVKMSNGNLEVATEGLALTMSKEWKGFDHGIREYIKQRDSTPERKLSRARETTDRRRNEIAQEAIKRSES